MSPPVIGRLETVVHDQVLYSAPIRRDSDAASLEQHAALMAAAYEAIPGNRGHVRTAWVIWVDTTLVEVPTLHDVLVQEEA